MSTLADQVGACTTVLQPLQALIERHVPAGQNKGLPSQRMKRIGDCDFLRRNPGTMSPLRIAAASVLP